MQKPRPMIQFIKNAPKWSGFNKEAVSSLVGVEVGVEAGINAESILNTLNMKRLYLVDPWYGEYEKYWDTVKGKFGLNEKVELLVLTSKEASSVITEPLDFVYIDANHKAYAVRKDIALWYPKVKQGGILGGHDFNLFDKSGCVTDGVIVAVTEFVFKTGYHLHIAYQEKCGDWWIIKGDRLED